MEKLMHYPVPIAPPDRKAVVKFAGWLDLFPKPLEKLPKRFL